MITRRCSNVSNRSRQLLLEALECRWLLSVGDSLRNLGRLAELAEVRERAGQLSKR